MLRRRLYILWADPRIQHFLHVTVNGFVSLVFLGGIAGPVITTYGPKYLPIGSKPLATPVATSTPSTPPPAHKKSPATNPTPATATTTPSPVTTSPAPAPVHSNPTPTPAVTSPGSAPRQLAPAPSSPPPSSPPASTDPGTTPATGGYTSSNWSGYVATAGNYTAISGSWKVPSSTGNNVDTTADSSWIGIGGVFDPDLIQTGTINVVSASGQLSSEAFYELLPDAALLIPDITVSAGDTMTASINEVATDSWQITLADITTGKQFTTTVSYHSHLSSAEWVEEDPSYTNATLVPFADFGTVFFSGSTTISGGSSQTIASSGGQPITMLNGSGQAVATPSVLNTAGTGFSVTHN